jgi:hypothetical protein
MALAQLEQPSANGAPGSSRLAQTRGDGYPAPGSASPKAVVDYVRRLMQDGDADAVERYKRATHNLLFADGRQFIGWSLRDKTWRDAPAPEGRLRVAMNYIRPILRARLQRLMSSEVSWNATPGSNAHEERDKATVATNVLESRWRHAELEPKVRAALWLAFSSGVAYLKQFWNPELGSLKTAEVVLPHPATGQPTAYPITQDGEPLMDPETGDPVQDAEEAFTYRPGDTDSAVRSIFNIRLNPDAYGLTPSEGFRWLIDCEVVPISVAKERYGEAARKVQTVEGISQFKQYEGLIRSVGRAAGHKAGNDSVAGRDGKQIPDKELTLVCEYWEAPSDPLPEGRLVVIAGEELIHDGPLPQGKVPYVAIYDERRPFDAYGRPTVDDLVSPQKVINRQWSLILEELALTGIGQWAYFDVPGMGDQITNAPAAHIKIPIQSALANRSIGDIVQRIQPGSTSPDRWRMIEQAKMVIFDIGAFHEIQRGQVPPGVDSGVAVELLQEAENGQLHDAVRQLKGALVEWGRQTLGLARWGYGEHEERWIPVERPDLGFLVESVHGSDLPDPETVNLDLDGFRPTSRAAFNAEVKEAMGQGWIDPRQGLKLMDLGRGVDGVFESQTRHYARARRENLAIERGAFQLIEAPENTPLEGSPALIHPEDGSPFMLPSDDVHEMHIEIHQEIALDDTKPWPVRQVALLHISEHRGMLQMQAAALAAAEQGQGQQPGEPQDTEMAGAA